LPASILHKNFSNSTKFTVFEGAGIPALLDLPNVNAESGLAAKPPPSGDFYKKLMAVGKPIDSGYRKLQ
jgi:hypothetical protein